MNTAVLGPGVECSAAGLGTGRESGFRTLDAYAQNRLVSAALEHGVTLFDTAPVYETEDALGRALGRRRASVCVCTKSPFGLGIRAGWKTVLERTQRRLEESLRVFGHVDVYYLHALTAGVLDKAMGALGEYLDGQKNEGNIRLVGLTEFYPKDREHEAVGHALVHPFDVMMLGYSATDRSVASSLLPAMRRRGIASVLMQVNSSTAPERKSGAAYEAALRRSGADAVLVGTRSPEHLVADLSHF